MTLSFRRAHLSAEEQRHLARLLPFVDNAALMAITGVDLETIRSMRRRLRVKQPARSKRAAGVETKAASIEQIARQRGYANASAALGDLQQAYDQGRVAWELHGRAALCPFKTALEKTAWRVGWLAARRELEKKARETDP